MKKTRILIFWIALFVLAAGRAKAADGFDNNFISANANELVIELGGNGIEKDILFGPGNMTSGAYFIQIPNGSVYDMGTVNHFKLKFAKTHPRSAYFDRVIAAKFYYRIYLQSESPPSFTEVLMTEENTLDPNTCYNQTQGHNWSYNFNFLNILNGLPNGDYFFECYTQLTLYDVGLENSPCAIDATLLCQGSENTGRFLGSQYTTTDPNVCPGDPNYYMDIQNNLAAYTKATLTITNSSAPLTWAAFQAQKVQSTIAVRWATAQEKDVDHFDLQRSNDGYKWETIHTRTARGTTGYRTDYEYVDKNPRPGIDYYRLIAVDFDGTETLSSTVAVPFGQGQQTVRIYPQPARDQIWLQMDDSILESATVVVIYDAAGRLVRRDNRPENHNEPLPIADLVPGLYLLQVLNDSGERLASGRLVVN